MLRLPEDIQVDICLRLPVNDVLACRWVCIPLRNLLCSPKFIKDHLERSIERNNPSLMIRAHVNGSNRVKKSLIYTTDYAKVSLQASSKPSMDLDTTERTMAILIKQYPIEYEEDSGVQILGSCNGLIAMHSSGKTGMGEDSNICIWNPATREYKRIPITFPGSRPFSRYGFGYDRSIDDYKFVRLSGSQAMIYTLGLDSWNTIETIPYMFCPETVPGVFLNGALHWLGRRITTDGTSTEVIASFDISNERFVDVPAPENTLPDHYELDKSVGVFRDCLCFVVHATKIRQCTVWVMQNYGVKDSWSKQITITRDSIPSSFWYNRITKPIWHLKNGEVLMINPRQGYVLYDPKNGKLDTMSIVFQSLTSGWDEPVCYVESLVSLNSGTYVENRTKWLHQERMKRQLQQ